MIVVDGNTRINLIRIKVNKTEYSEGLEMHFNDPAMMKAEFTKSREEGPRIALLPDLAGLDSSLLAPTGNERVPQSGFKVRIPSDEPGTPDIVVEFTLKGFGHLDWIPGDPTPLEKRVNMRQQYAIAASDKRKMAQNRQQELAQPITEAPTFKPMSREELRRQGLI